MIRTEVIAVSAETGNRVELIEGECAGPLHVIGARFIRPNEDRAPYVVWALHDEDRDASGWHLNVAQRTLDVVGMQANMIQPASLGSEAQARFWVKMIAAQHLYAYEGQS